MFDSDTTDLSKSVLFGSKHQNFGSKYWGECVNCKHALAERQNLEFGFQTPQKNLTPVRLVRFQLVLCCFCLSHIPNSASQHVCTRLLCVWRIEDCAICAGLLSREVTWPLRGFVKETVDGRIGKLWNQKLKNNYKQFAKAMKSLIKSLCKMLAAKVIKSKMKAF